MNGAPLSKLQIGASIVAPLVTAMLLGIFGLWVKSIKTDIEIARAAAIEVAITKTKVESTREFYPSTKGMVLEERIGNLITKVTSMDEKLDKILQRDYERRASSGSSNAR